MDFDEYLNRTSTSAKEHLAHIYYLDQQRQNIEATEKAEREYDAALQFREAIGQEIANLIARAEAAENRVHDLETLHRTEMCEDGYDCVELGKVRKALQAAEDENKKLLDAMMHIRKTENFQKCKVVYEMEFSDALDHGRVRNIAAMVFRGLMEADIKRRGKKEG